MTKIEKFLEENPDYKSINQSGSVEYKILNYLKDIENGFFVEAGAYDGLFQSNTKILEDLGWTGLLIEPSYEKSIECYNNRSKKSIVSNSALVSFDYKNETINGDFGSPVSSVYGNGKLAQSRTLTYLLDQLEISHIDFFSLDTEGYELEVLKGIDFDRISFGYLLIEINSNFYSIDQIDNLLLNKGYIRVANISNFVKEYRFPFFSSVPGWPGTHQDYLYKNKNLL